MKKALYYAIRVRTMYPHVVAVTSVKKKAWGHDRWFGRREQFTEATNGTIDQLRGNFETKEVADKMLSAVTAIEAEYKIKHDALSKQMTKLYREEHDAIDALFETEPKP